MQVADTRMYNKNTTTVSFVVAAAADDQGFGPGCTWTWSETVVGHGLHLHPRVLSCPPFGHHPPPPSLSESPLTLRTRRLHLGTMLPSSIL